MKNTKRIVLAMAILLIVTMAAPAFAAVDVTVGSLLQEIAKLNNLPAVDGDVAMQSLRAAGMNIPALVTRKALTEGDVVSISEVIGLNLSTKDPESVFSRAQLDGFLDSFGDELDVNDIADNGLPGAGDEQTPAPAGHGNGSGNSKGADPLTKGKGKKKGHNRSPSEPE